MIKLRAQLSTCAIFTAREISQIDLLYSLLALFLRCSLEVPGQAVDSGHFVLGVTLELIVILIALVMIERGVSTTIGSVCRLT